MPIIFGFCNPSCRINKDKDEFNVLIKNDYFEQLDSVYFDTSIIINLKPQTTTNALKYTQGQYHFSALTASHLKITANINLKGTQEQVTIIIINQGIVGIE